MIRMLGVTAFAFPLFLPVPGCVGLVALVGQLFDFGDDLLSFPRMLFKLALYVGLMLGGKLFGYGRSAFRR